MKKIEIYDKKWKNIAIITAIIIAVIIIVAIIINRIVHYKVKQEVVATEAKSSNELLKDNEIEWFENNDDKQNDIYDIINENVNKTEKEEIQTETVELEYETEYTNNEELPKGMVKVLQQGEDGKQELIIRKKYNGEELVSDEQIGRKITSPCINKIVEVGTASYYDKHTIKVGETVYSTPYNLAIRENPEKTAEVLIKISQDSKLKILKKSSSWYYVEYGSYYGWVEKDCVTYLNPTKNTYNNKNDKYTKVQLLTKLNKNIDLSKPSGFSLEQFKKVLSNNNQDKNKVFENNAEYFYYIEQQYGINGVFVAAIGIHESAWGTSKIARDKKNLFGYGAYDMSAYSAGIDMIARVLVKHYLNPKGTSIYDGEKATGRFYNGKTLTAVNKRYATDKNWSSSVYKWMQYLYKKL